MQVLANILSNAVKFTEKGEVVVEGKVEQPQEGGEGQAAGCLFHISVRDTGIGIPKEAMPKLFQCFRQGHESMTRKYGGTGAYPFEAENQNLCSTLGKFFSSKTVFSHVSGFVLSCLCPFLLHSRHVLEQVVRFIQCRPFQGAVLRTARVFEGLRSG